MADPVCERLTLIGVGLIGSSIARAARQFGAARRIAVMDSSPQVVSRAGELCLADVATQDYAEAVRGADLVIVCTPVGACGDVAQSLAPHLEKGAVLSDVGSVKGAVVAQMTPHLAEPARFIPAHPIAGTEFSGPDAGFATLFQNRWCILTPPDNADAAAVERLTTFWMRLGANVETMSVAHHDAVLALTSHLPHLIAYNIVGTADDFGDETRSEVIKFSASGFRDFTRIAASDPIMWRDIFLANKDAVLQMLGRFNEDLSALQRMIRRNDGQGLLEFFSRTRDIRRSIVEQGQDTAAPDFGRRAEGR
ncbi:MAG: prephenate/arogenate dehydrogenase family protein [Methylocystis silviterrae]|uniref:prephenate/arogenate dehydrogenase family protein n=1 Tax=Methylocystis silviterrae TaxID=2743612 RepID=UPI003C728AD3